MLIFIGQCSENSGFGDGFKGFLLDKDVKKVCKLERIRNSLKIIVKPIPSGTFWSFTEREALRRHQIIVIMIILLII